MANPIDKKNNVSFHPRNPHKGRYKLEPLSQTTPALKHYIINTPKGGLSIDFSDDKAVLCLNQALLAHYYKIRQWTIPEGYLCPPIPGRADYIHHLADLLPNDDKENHPKENRVRVLDIGTGANGIYPIIGSQCYGWQFVASDIDPNAIKSLDNIIRLNPCLQGFITPVRQQDKQAIFKNIIKQSDRFNLTLCNPPFHASQTEALASNQRKVRNLGKGQHKKEKIKASTASNNFGGKNNELWCPGGELSFLKRMISESQDFGKQVCWFSSLVSKSDNIRPLKKLLMVLGAKQVRVVPMSQGQKVSRFIAWSFLTEEAENEWRE